MRKGSYFRFHTDTDTGRYRVVRVTLPSRDYHTVQLDNGSPWGPLGAKLEIVRSGLSLVAAIRSRDLLDNINPEEG